MSKKLKPLLGSKRVFTEFSENYETRNISSSLSPISSTSSSSYSGDIFEEIDGTGKIRASDYFKGSRKYVERKRRTCQKRAEPITAEQKKEESSRNSRNYTKRNREEILYVREKLCVEKQKLELQCQVANGLMGNSFEAKIRNFVDKSFLIIKNYVQNWEKIVKKCEIEQFFQAFISKQQLIGMKECNPDVYNLEKEFNDLKLEFDELLKNKEKYIMEKGRTNFASSKSRLFQRLTRAELKRECYLVHCATEGIENKIKLLVECNNELRENIFQKLIKIDSFLRKKCKMKEKDEKEWDKIMRFFDESDGSDVSDESQPSDDSMRRSEKNDEAGFHRIVEKNFDENDELEKMLEKKRRKTQIYSAEVEIQNTKANMVRRIEIFGDVDEDPIDQRSTKNQQPITIKNVANEIIKREPFEEYQIHFSDDSLFRRNHLKFQIQKDSKDLTVGELLKLQLIKK